MFLGLLFAAFVAFNLTTLPASGHFIVFDDGSDGAALIDASRIERDGDLARVPIIFISGPTANTGREFGLLGQEFDCKARRARSADYAMFGEDLSHIQTRTMSNSHWEEIRPYAPIMTAFHYVCTGKPLPTGETDLHRLAQIYWRTNNVSAD